MNVPMNSTLRVAQLLCLLQRVDGRKKFHKLVHILQEFDCPFSEQFDYSYYGMYSRELRSEVETLVQEKLVRETPSPNQAGEHTYIFESTSDLEVFLHGLGIGKKPAWEQLATQLNSLHTQMLEGISTILFLRRRGLEAGELKTRFLALKPHLADIYAQCEQEAKKLKSPKARLVEA
jgi:uncharacterized protein YwgA